jgi:hypothetical protein
MTSNETEEELQEISFPTDSEQARPFWLNRDLSRDFGNFSFLHLKKA